MSPTLVSLFASLSLAGLAIAQSPQLVGVSQSAPFIVSHDTGSCAQTQCTPAGLPPAPPGFPFVGGTAYDPTTRGIWASNGLLMAKVAADGSCAPQCPVLPVPNTSPNNPVTGMAYNELTSTMFITDRSNVIRWYSVAGGCQLSIVGRCIAPVGSNNVITGCATDDPAGLIFYSVVTPGSPGGRVLVAQQGAPCSPFCNIPVTTCGGNTMAPLTGLAWDGCAQVLWATDGKLTVGLNIDMANCTVLGEVQCCVNTIDPLIGLALVPGAETVVGTSCTTGTCPTCPSLEHTLGGDPVIGNPAFSLDLINAPGQTAAYLILNVGPCTTGSLSPPFCSPIYPSLVFPLVGGAFPTGGTLGNCDGGVIVNLPLPTNPALCGVGFCTQFLGFCGGFSSHYLSNALDWVVTTV